MCCFFRTAVTSFPVKSHSHNSHFMCRGAGPERVGPLEPTRNHIDSSGTCETRTDLPGHWSDVGDIQSIIAAVMFVDTRPVLRQALCCLSSFEMAVLRSAVRPRREMSCYFFALAAHQLAGRWLFLTVLRCPSAYRGDLFFFIFFSVILCRKV